MTRIYYPVTAAEIGHAVTRDDVYGCTIAVREHFTPNDGFNPEGFAMLSYGHANCYHYVKRNGLVYGVSRHDEATTEYRT